MAIITTARRPAFSAATAAVARPGQSVHMRLGNPNAPILIVCDAMGADKRSTAAWERNSPLTNDAAALTLSLAKRHGIRESDIQFVGLCAPMDEVTKSSQKREWAHVEPNVESLKAIIQQVNPKLVVTMGNLASRALFGRSVAITKARGQIERKDDLPPVMPMLSPGFVLRVPEHEPVASSDWLTVSKLAANNWRLEGLNDAAIQTDYQWRADISDFLGANKPKVIASDTETTGLKWYLPEVFPFLWQFSPEPGKSILLPIHEQYWEKVFPNEPFSQMEEAKRQMAELVEDPAVRMMGHNFKYDHHMKRKVRVQRADGSCTPLQPRGWLHDTQIMAFQVNENMMQLNLDECVRVFVPEMAGYADEFNATINKDDMINVAPETMLPYAGGDPDAVYRLARALKEILRKDPRQWNVMQRIQMPAYMMFAQVTEPAGVLIDQERLRTFGEEVKEFTRDEYRSLIRQVPSAIRKKHMAAAQAAGGQGTKAQTEALSKALSFTRPDFTRDVLFSKDGLGLKPQVFTDSTKMLKGDERLPSTSAKDHFPYFVTHPKHGDFVNRLGEYLKTKHMSSTYIGEEDEGNGFWQYIGPDGCIHPSFSLTKTNTGRTASADPNGQNFPKRGRFAKAYQQIFVARPGKRIAASDLSQIELRLIAWMANEPEMLAVYRAGGDIHASTAAAALGISDAEFATWNNREIALSDRLDLPGARQLFEQTKPEKRLELTLNKLHALQRFRAKAVNFGFCYGAQAETFRTYAKTNYGVDYTEDEAHLVRERYFTRYGKLLDWHDAMRQIAKKHGMVRAMHGAARHLPSIFSQDRKIVSSTERQAINAPIQRMGSDLCLLGAYRFQAQVDPEIARVILTVHDQVVLECAEGYEEAMIRALCWAMQNPPLERMFGITAPLPFGSDAEISISNMGEMEERTDLQAAKPEWWNDDEDAVVNAFCMGDPMFAFTREMKPERALVFV